MKLKKGKAIIVIIALMFFVSHSVQGNSTIEWDEWQDESYWEWHTRNTTDDKAYNGKHIVIDKDVIDFYGYWKNSYKDFLYKKYDKQGKKIFKFRIDESKASYHTLDGAGFIFNANKVDNKLSGYVILFKEKDVCLYRLDSVDINTFETASKATLATYGELIESKPKLNSDIHDLIVEVTPTNIKITESDDEIINIKLDYSKHSGESFGLISSYVQHACSILSKIQFSELEIIIEDYKISILNTDLQGNPIPGGYFEVKDENGQIIKEGKTDKNATISIDGIIPGIYTVQQKTPPETYILNDNIYTFKVTEEGEVIDVDSEQEIELIVKNEQLKIEIENKVLNTEKPIAESKIGLYDANGNHISTQITDKNGIVTFTGITQGEYTYKQLDVPNGYELNTNEYECILNIDGTAEFDENNKNIIYNKEIEEVEEESKKTTVNNTIINNEDNTIAKTIIPYAGEKNKMRGVLVTCIIIVSMGILITIKKI